MRNVIRFEWKRCMGAWGLKLSLLFSLFLVVMNVRASYQMFGQGDIYREFPYVFTEAWLPMNYQFVYRALFYTLFPVLAALPMGTSFYRDVRTGYMKNIYVKAPGKAYYMGKFAVAFMAGFLVIFLPMLVDLMAELLIYPVLPIDPFANLGIVTDGDFLAALYYDSPLAYALCYCVVDGVFGGIFSVACLCISRYVKSGFAVLMLPFVFYMVSELVLEATGWTQFSLYTMVDAVRLEKLSAACAAGGMALGAGLCFWWFGYHERRKDVL